MNWKTYFSLQDKRKKWFKVFIILVFLVHIFMVKEHIFRADQLCENINYSCKATEIKGPGQTDNSSRNITNHQDTNQGNMTDNESNTSSDQANMINISEREHDERNTHNASAMNLSANATREKDYISRIFLRCDFGCEVTSRTEAKIWSMRFFYTPIFVLTDAFIAYILSYGFYAFFFWKEKKKEGGEKGGKGDEKEEGKDKEEKR